MLIKFWLAVVLFAATTNAESFYGRKLLNVLGCGPPTNVASSLGPPKSPDLRQFSCTTPPSCNNCPKPDCSMVPSGTKFPYANHCKLYYQCIDGNAVVSVCSNGYWYDRALSKCMLCDLVLNCEAKTD